MSDPVPLGRQLLEAAALDPRDGYSLVAILPSGDFEDVRLDEPFDLRERGAERFIAFLTDREFKLTLTDHELMWGKPAISATILYGLAKPADVEGVFLEVPGGEDRLVEHGELIDLSQPGIERFITGRLTFEIIVDSRRVPVNARTGHVRADCPARLPGPARTRGRFIFDDLPPCGVDAACRRAGAGGSVDVKKKGTVFNVTRTVQS